MTFSAYVDQAHARYPEARWDHFRGSNYAPDRTRVVRWLAAQLFVEGDVESALARETMRQMAQVLKYQPLTFE